MKNLRKLSVFILVTLAPVSVLFTITANAQGWQWAKGSTGGNLECSLVTTDVFGNVFAAGSAQSGPLNFGSVSVPFTTSGWETFITKYDNAGNLLWAQGINIGQSTPVSITTDTAGNLILLGIYPSGFPMIQVGTINLYGSASYFWQYFLVKYDPSGNVIWAKTSIEASANYTAYAYPSMSPGEPQGFNAGSVTTDIAGSIFVTGSFNGTSATIGSITLTNSDPSGATDDIFVAKYDKTGNVTWAKDIGGNDTDNAFGITVTPAGNIYFTGTFRSPLFHVGSLSIVNSYGVEDAFIAELDTLGNALWVEAAGGSKGAYGVALTSDAANNVYLTGSFGDPTISFGATTLNRHYSSFFPKMAQYLVKITPANTVTWGKVFDSPSLPVFGFGIGYAPCGQIWTCGSWTTGAAPWSVNIDGNILTAPSGSTDPMFIAGFNSSGSYQNSSAIGSGGDDFNGIACDRNGNVFVSSDYYGLGSVFLIDTISLPVASIYVELFFVAKYSNATSNTDTTFQSTDTSFCSQGSAILQPPTGYGTGYLWNNGSTSPTLTVNAAGTYWVTCQGNCTISTLIDTFHVAVIPVDSATRTTLLIDCTVSGVINLNGDPGYSAYEWNTGASTINLPVNDTGVYWVQETKLCAIATDTFKVILAPQINVIASATVTGCNSTIDLLGKPAESDFSYVWTGPAGYSNNAQNPIIYNPSLTETGIYTLTVTDNTDGCSETDTAIVAFNPAIEVHLTYVTTSQSIEYGSSIQLNADSAEFFKWVPDDGSLSNPNINNPVAQPTQTTTYTVYGANNAGCMDSANITVYVITDSIIIPSSFTPNGDGLNDIFRPIGMFNQKLIEFSIYNKWGQQVFTTTNKNQGWDGTFNGEKSDMGVYYYALMVVLENGNTRLCKGDVTLLR